MKHVKIIGGGIAGCEAALQLASNGYAVNIIDNKNHGSNDLYKLKTYGELVCMNSLGGHNLNIPSGMFRYELELMGSKLIEIARQYEIPNNTYFSVDKNLFSSAVSEELKNNNVNIIVDNVTKLPDDEIVIIATGPNTNIELMKDISSKCNNQDFFTQSAVFSAIYGTSIDFNNENIIKIDDNTYVININEELFNKISTLIASSTPTHFHKIDEEIDFSHCNSVDNIAKMGKDILREKVFSHPSYDKPCIVLEKDKVLHDVFNIKNFNTTMGVLRQQDIIRLVPGLENCIFARFGLMHKDTYFNSPGFLDCFFKVKNFDKDLYLIGQISGCDGYLRAMASGVIAAHRIMYGDSLQQVSKKTMIGGLTNYISNGNNDYFQPMSASFSLIEGYSNYEKQEQVSRNELQKYMDFITGYKENDVNIKCMRKIKKLINKES